MTFKHPSLMWLIKNDPDAALAVFHRLRDEYYSFSSDKPAARFAANDNERETHSVADSLQTAETLSEGIDISDDIYGEMLHEVKPDFHDMLRYAGGIAWPWCGVRIKYDGKVKWVGEPWAYDFPLAPEVTGKDLLTLGRLTFYTRPGAPHASDCGMMHFYVDDNGKERRPGLSAATLIFRGGDNGVKALMFATQRTTPAFSREAHVTPDAWIRLANAIASAPEIRAGRPPTIERYRQYETTSKF